MVCSSSADNQQLKMSDHIEEKIKNYRTAPFDARFPNTNQTRNCYQNYLGKQDTLPRSVPHTDLVHKV